MNVTTLPANRQRKAQQHAPRSGGRTTERDGDATLTQTSGATALQPKRETTAPKHGSDQPSPPRLGVAPPAPVSAPRAPFVALVLVLVIAGVVGILVLNTMIAENAFLLNDLKKQQSTLDQDEQRLRSDLADKESPAKLKARATQLGLVPSKTPQFLLLPDGRTLEMPGPGSGK